MSTEINTDQQTPLERIAKLLAQAEAIWNELPRDVQDALSERHDVSEETSLRHCLRWGAQHAAEMPDVERSLAADASSPRP